MILATYTTTQHQEEDASFVALKNHLGYSPVFCFKAENAREAIINSIMASPFAPEKLVLFNGTPKNKLDYVQWNRFKAEQNKDVEIEDCFTEQDDLYQIPLVEHIDNVIIEIDIKKSFFMSESVDAQEWKGFLADVIQSAQTCAINLCQNIKPILAVDVPIEAYDHAAKLIMKEGFQYFILPLFYPIVLNRQLSYSTYFNYKDYMDRMTINKIARLCNSDESMTDKTYAKFEEIIKDIRFATDKTYERVLVDGFNGSNSQLGPNSMCPCGSGKKYKKCCKNSTLERL